MPVLSPDSEVSDDRGGACATGAVGGIMRMLAGPSATGILTGLYARDGLEPSDVQPGRLGLTTRIPHRSSSGLEELAHLVGLTLHPGDSLDDDAPVDGRGNGPGNRPRRLRRAGWSAATIDSCAPAKHHEMRSFRLTDETGLDARGWSDERFEWHRRLGEKYRRAATSPWLPVEPDPTEPPE